MQRNNASSSPAAPEISLPATISIRQVLPDITCKRKILITGSVGSGKTTLARQLSAHLNIPHHELDCIVRYRTPTGRVKRTPEEQQDEIHRIDCADGHWIFEGVNRPSYRFLFEMADIILFLDTSIWGRRWRIFRRSIRQQLKIEHCEYESDWELLWMMLRWSKEFEQEKPEFTRMLAPYHTKTIRLTSSKFIR